LIELLEHRPEVDIEHSAAMKLGRGVRLQVVPALGLDLMGVGERDHGSLGCVEQGIHRVLIATSVDVLASRLEMLARRRMSG
jgi:hypothetical protein